MLPINQPDPPAAAVLPDYVPQPVPVAAQFQAQVQVEANKLSLDVCKFYLCTPSPRDLFQLSVFICALCFSFEGVFNVLYSCWVGDFEFYIRFTLLFFGFPWFHILFEQPQLNCCPRFLFYLADLRYSPSFQCLSLFYWALLAIIDLICYSLNVCPCFILACEYSRSRYYVRNAKKDVGDSRPEIPYWWRKSVPNPDRSADWSTELFCIISSIIIQCCDSVKWGWQAYTTSTVRDICTFAFLCSVIRPFLSLHSCLWRALVL